jgi:hypothetical protein
MTEDQETRGHMIWDLAVKDCLAEGLTLGETLGLLLQFNAGAMKGLVGGSASRKEILRLRDEIWSEFTLLADRCDPTS